MAAQLKVVAGGESMSTDRQKALEAALAQIDRAFGKGSAMKLGSREQIEIETISTGSLGLDIALSRLALRRIADNEMPVAPTINLNDQLTFARTVMTLNPRDLTDVDRDRIVAAIARGRQRVAAAGSRLNAVLALANEAQLPASVRQTLPWLLTRTPEAAPGLFGLRDLLWLGKPELSREALDRWGVYSEVLDSRLRTAMPPPAPWDDFGGRAEADSWPLRRPTSFCGWRKRRLG